MACLATPPKCGSGGLATTYRKWLGAGARAGLTLLQHDGATDAVFLRHCGRIGVLVHAVCNLGWTGTPDRAVWQFVFLFFFFFVPATAF